MKERLINHIIEVEGGYVNDSKDSGGETNFGITALVARANGYLGRMDCLPKSVAFDIYAAKYWDTVKAYDLLAVSAMVCEEVVDTSINLGPGRAGKFLQRALKTVDGAIGPATIYALRGYIAQRDEKTLCKALNCLQGSYYIELAEHRAKDERFVYGWFKNRVTL